MDYNTCKSSTEVSSDVSYVINLLVKSFVHVSLLTYILSTLWLLQVYTLWLPQVYISWLLQVYVLWLLQPTLISTQQ